jgi:hypothetical protein
VHVVFIRGLLFAESAFLPATITGSGRTIVPERAGMIKGGRE